RSMRHLVDRLAGIWWRRAIVVPPMFAAFIILIVLRPFGGVIGLYERAVAGLEGPCHAADGTWRFRATVDETREPRIGVGDAADFELVLREGDACLAYVEDRTALPWTHRPAPPGTLRSATVPVRVVKRRGDAIIYSLGLTIPPPGRPAQRDHVFTLRFDGDAVEGEFETIPTTSGRGPYSGDLRGGRHGR
ncbi:MAG TPA: hypothetical protein VJM14_04790, partial [Burkholderiales bacterium]|nr:hypothetical protein [Burkholderiales bacterium]